MSVSQEKNPLETRGAYKILEDLGYDGLVYQNNMEDLGKDSWVIFHTNQVC